MARQERAVSVPYGTQQNIRFPQLCVHCLAPPSAVRDLTISDQMQEQVGNRFRTHHYQVTIKDIPYCAKHAQQSVHIQKIMDRAMGSALVVALVVPCLAAVVSIVDRTSWGTSWEPLAVFVGLFLAVYTVLWIAIKLISGIILRLRFGDMLGLSGALGINGTLLFPIEKGKFTSVKPSLIRLKFKHPEYARMFAEANGLVEPSLRS